mmetsp:Transcript_6196/g.13951  ORF Transcript_6196/g.13951 Transcript_6196/m.13951 type:complete len:81 (+) Transcript_6196:667-909(+)
MTPRRSTNDHMAIPSPQAVGQQQERIRLGGLSQSEEGGFDGSGAGGGCVGLSVRSQRQWEKEARRDEQHKKNLEELFSTK